MMKKFKGLKSLATKLHSWFHLSLDGKKPKHKADYYDVAFAHFEKRCESIEKKIDKLSKRQQKRAPS
ncbi:MAG TPA: hypothetical protein ENF20_08550, partial [Candidatus Marinimicrobia bacterium]|nr:hypothetical protein [Candidatus Neomarinimicrobiota bacterium]